MIKEEIKENNLTKIDNNEVKIKKNKVSIQVKPKDLQEIKNGKQKFQLPNFFPSSSIIPPNLFKIRYYTNDPNKIEKPSEEYEDWSIENALNDKKNIKIKMNKNIDANINPNNQGKLELKRKMLEKGLDNKISVKYYQKNNDMENKRKDLEGEEEIEKSEGQLLYEKQRDYYLKMINEDNIDNINNFEDLNNLQIQKQKGLEIKKDNNYKIKKPQNENITQVIKNKMVLNPNTEQNNEDKNPLRKKENITLFPPGYNLLKNKGNNNNIICVNHSKLPINYQDRDPRNYKGMPPCMLSSIIPAGKPSQVDKPLNIFENEYSDYYNFI